MAPVLHDAHVRLRSKKDGAWFVHPDLRPRLVEDAKDQGSNMTDVALGILHKRYGLTFVPNGRVTDPRPEDDIIRLRLPQPLYTALVRSHGVKYVEAIRQILCAHYALRIPAKPRRTRNRVPKLAA